MTEHDKHTISSFEATAYELADLAQHAHVVHLAVRALANSSSVKRVGYGEAAHGARGDLAAAVTALDSAADNLLCALTGPDNDRVVRRRLAELAEQCPSECDCVCHIADVDGCDCADRRRAAELAEQRAADTSECDCVCHIADVDDCDCARTGLCVRPARS